MMTNFDELKHKAKETMETIADRSIELYKIAEEKTKLLAKSAKLSAEIALDKGSVRNMYKDLGKKYYDAHISGETALLGPECAEITTALERIADKQKELDALRDALNMGAEGGCGCGDPCCDDDDDDMDDDDVEVEVVVEADIDPVPDLTNEEVDAATDEIIGKPTQPTDAPEE